MNGRCRLLGLRIAMLWWDPIAQSNCDRHCEDSLQLKVILDTVFRTVYDSSCYGS